MSANCEKALEQAMDVMSEVYSILDKTPQLDENSTEDEISMVEASIVRALELLK